MRFLRFWRTPWLPAALAALLAVLGVPVFLRLPLWCDVTLYDVAARTILTGGVHYRDVFDTNTPGYVWCLTVLRRLLGPSDLAVRAADLAIFAGVAALLDRLAKLGGASSAARWWALAGMLSFYPFNSESLHAQRDVWLTLPLLAAVLLRLKRMTRPPAETPPRYFWPAFAEGLLWGAATWIKPHAIPLALAVWLLTVRRLSGGSWRIAGRDLAGNLAAGIGLGLAGVALLVASGTWPHFLDVMMNWNGHYTDLIRGELGLRVHSALRWFPPWSLMLVPTLLLVLLSFVDGRVLSTRWLPVGERGPIGRAISERVYDPGPTDAARFARAVLAGLYLAWVVESFFFQRGFHYAHVPETLLMLALWASHRLCLPAFVLAWIAALSLTFRIADDVPELKDALRRGCFYDYDTLESDYRHPLAKPGYAAGWVAALTTPTTGQDDARLKDRLKRTRGHEATSNWEELGEVEAYLRAQGVRDREVVCWDDGVHPLYLSMGIRPGLRFMHVHSAESIGPNAPHTILTELRANPHLRFVVTDLEWVSYVEYEAIDRPVPYRPGRDLAKVLPAKVRGSDLKWTQVFPFDGREVVFRSDGDRGRYVVFALSAPLNIVE